MKTKGRATKDEIISIASRLFFGKGFHRVSFQMIAKEMSLTQPALYSYFKNKEEILLAVAQKSVIEGQDFIDRQHDEMASAGSRLKSYVMGNLKWVIEKREAASSILAIYYFGASQQSIKKFHFLINQGGSKRIETLVMQGIREGIWQVKDAHGAARAVHGLLSGEMIKAFHWPKEMTFEKRMSEVWSGVERLVSR